MTDKELDKLFREKFEEKDFAFRESSWENAQKVIEQTDPAAVDDLMRRKFAAQSFAFKESSWTAAKTLVDSMYRGLLIRQWTTRAAVFMGVLGALVLSEPVWNASNGNGIDVYGRPAIAELAAVDSENTASKEAAQESLATASGEDELTESSQGATTTSAEESIASAENFASEEKSSTSELAFAELGGGEGGTNTPASTELSGEAADDQNGVAFPAATESESPTGEEGSGQNAMAEVSESEEGQQSAETGIEEEVTSVIEDEDDAQGKAPAPRPSAPGMFNPINGKSSYFGLAFGARIYEDFASTETGAIQFAPTVGLRYAYMFHPKLSANIGGFYAYRRSTHSAHQFSGASYSFGAHNQTVSLVSTEMHQLEVPLYLRYQVARGHHINFGGYVNATLATKNESVSTTTAPYSADVLVESDEWGHMPGMREVGYGLMLGYDYRINENWQIGFRGQWGLVDWSDDAVFSDSPYDRNKEIKVLLEYRLND
ncbi:outer membrane beta-barrel protein [Cryomorphaceae bacterium]|nr:outer membrane beta-barrel protein [Cryomorphaceae bacterium]